MNRSPRQSPPHDLFPHLPGTLMTSLAHQPQFGGLWICPCHNIAPSPPPFAKKEEIGKTPRNWYDDDPWAVVETMIRMDDEDDGWMAISMKKSNERKEGRRRNRGGEKLSRQ
eukprot:TRINITY_DN7541_c0_g1_i1.p2 TRINITY_DN7541_c0_g1~~TRINITY_DN7541_c0_g1_i1.p2  ORF type:complete len:112 (+),score=31.41 TRINITY_DN7541_c0_g1_i1:408-743(+)